MLGHVFQRLREDHANDLELTGARTPSVENVPVIDFADAQDLLVSRYGEERDDEDLSPSQERALCRWAE
ncbi:MAG: hypothetical protein WKH64_03795 [Chloroflexia bacterium]